MKKYIFGAVLSIGLLVSPAFTQAAGLTTVQINAIISLLSSFGADQSVINNVQVSLTGGAPTTSGGFCHTFNTNLTVGSSGADVAALIKIFWMKGWESYGDGTNPNSVFTENTASGVVGFQTNYGISQTGYVGPLTRAKLNVLYGCGVLTPVDIKFSVSPSSGTAPLWVRFSAALPSGMTNNLPYSINFGDGSSGAMAWDNGKGTDTAWFLSVPHTYAAAGTYTAQLLYQPPFVCNAPSGAACAQIMPAQQIVGTVTIMVTSAGTTQAPVISGVSGPTSLQTGQQGMWTVNASDPNNGTLSYAVQWGDENLVGQAAMAYMPRLQQTTTFTHVYSQAGNYTPMFFVTNNAGQSQTSISVNVGGTIQACTTEAKICSDGTVVGRTGPNCSFAPCPTASTITVFSPNGGEFWIEGTTQVITWQDNNPIAGTGSCPANALCAPTQKTYDILLVPFYVPTPCDGVTIHCTGAIPASYIITTGVSGSLYSWLVGQGHIIPAYYDTNTAPDGQYKIQVCQTGTSVCDSSDQLFTITSYPGGV